MERIAVHDENGVTGEAPKGQRNPAYNEVIGQTKCLPVQPGLRFLADLPLQGDRSQTRDTAR
jgi:hypothetical protein